MKVNDLFANLPNFITLVRLGVIPVIVTLTLAHQYMPALIFFGLSGVLDFLDGFLARRLQVDSKLGEWMDPLAHKILKLSTLAALVATAVSPQQTVLAVALTLLITIEISIGALMGLAATMAIEIRAYKLMKFSRALIFSGVAVVLLSKIGAQNHVATAGCLLLCIGVLINAISSSRLSYFVIQTINHRGVPL